MDRILHHAVTVPATLDAVWAAWTTAEGAQTFFAPQANLRLELGGPYEILFNLEQPPGLQGSEGCRVLSYLPHSMLSFEWNAPPIYPDLRGQHTWVVLQFAETPEGVRVELSHLGWGEGGDWDAVYDYFVGAWRLVLARLEHRFAVGPLDWSDPWRPDGA